MEEPSLEGCREKIKRARTHLEALYEEIDAFNEPNPYEFVEKIDSEARKYEVRLKILREPPELEWGVLLGDYLHNLRCALDHLVGQLALLSGHKIRHCNQFPIAVTEADYWQPKKEGEQSHRDWRLTGVAEEYRKPIDLVQPYRAGDQAHRDALFLLNRLSNLDKHRFIHPTWTMIAEVTEDNFDIVSTAGSGFADIETTHGVLEDGDKVLTATFHGDPKVHLETNLTLDVGFGQRRDGRGGIIAPGLGTILTRVQNIIRAYEAAFAAAHDTPGP